MCGHNDVDLIVEGSSLQGFLADPKGAHSQAVPGQAGTHYHSVSTAMSLMSEEQRCSMKPTLLVKDVH